MKKTITLILTALVAFSSVAVAADFAPASVMAEQTHKKAKAEIKEVTFNVTIHCKNCLKKLQENLPFEKGVKDLHICMDDQVVSFKYDASKTNEETLKNAIIKLGVPFKGKSQAGHQHNHK